MLGTNDVQVIFADRLKYLRTAEKLTQDQLAEKLGVSRGSISYYENCDRVPDIVFLTKAAEFFSTTTNYLLGYSSNRYNSDATFPENWGDFLLSDIKNHLMMVIDHYEKFLKPLEDENLYKIFYLLIIGDNILSSSLYKDLITKLSEVKEMNYADIEILVDEFISRFYNFSYTSSDGKRLYSSHQAEQWLLAWIEKQRSGYENYLENQAYHVNKFMFKKFWEE